MFPWYSLWCKKAEALFARIYELAEEQAKERQDVYFARLLLGLIYQVRVIHTVKIETREPHLLLLNNFNSTPPPSSPARTRLACFPDVIIIIVLVTTSFKTRNNSFEIVRNRPSRGKSQVIHTVATSLNVPSEVKPFCAKHC